MESSIINTITRGEKLRLRDDVLPLVEKRLWIFAGIGERDTILLAQEDARYIWATKPSGIDWEEYKRRKNLD